MATEANEAVWKDVTNVYLAADGGERYVRTLSTDCWISVLYRLTGFGYHEWETAICFRNGDEQETLIIAGDRREELATMPREKLRQWYADNIEGNRNSFDSVMQAIKERAKCDGCKD